MKKIKEWAEIIGLGGLLAGGGILAFIMVALVSIAISTAPFVIVIWVIWKLFFN